MRPRSWGLQNEIVRHSYVVFLMSLFVGCSTPLGGGQPAHVLPHKAVRASVAAEALVPTGVVRDTVDGARTVARAASTDRPLTQMEQRQLLAAGVALATIPPGVPMRLDVAYGLLPDLEVDLRLASGSFWRLGARYQVLHQDASRFDLSLGLAVGWSAFKFPMPSWIEDYVRIDDFTRLSFELPAALGQHNDYLRWWIGPRFIYWRASTALSLTPPGQAVEGASARAGGLFLGGQAGIAAGYKKLFVGVELTLTQAIGNADLRFLELTTAVPLSTFIIYPSLFLLGEF